MAIAGNSQQLHVKSFFAATVKEALQQAHLEMGPDALLLQAREAPLEARHLGACEVVLGLARPTAGFVPGVTRVENPGKPAASGAIDEALVALKSFMRTLPAPAPTHDSLVEETLTDAGIRADMAREIESAVRQQVNRRPVIQMGKASALRTPHSDSVTAIAAEQICARFEVQPGLGRVTALIGPPGMGKTTTLVKLAVREGLRANRPIRLISADTHRIGGADQLRTFATILGVPFQSVESATTLALAIEAAPAAEMLLIDTPGYSTALHAELAAELTDFFSNRQDIDTHLVLTATATTGALERWGDLYRFWRPSKLLFTNIDETESLASVYCEAVRQKLPLSYFGSGQSIPEDLEPASKERIAESLVRGLPQRLQAVA